MNKHLLDIYNEDIADRNNKNLSDSDRDKRDILRIEKVQEILRTTTLEDAIDYHHAALIFQHGESVEDFIQANKLAEIAVEKGDDSARWLYAASKDRSLLMSGKPQKYGTQFIKDENGQWDVAQPIDPEVTDEERAEWGVLPLSEALKVYKQKYQLD